MPPVEATSNTDSNYGIDDKWVKIVIHFSQSGTYDGFNLPRIFWANKEWTLKELHHHYFDHHKDLFSKWY